MDTRNWTHFSDSGNIDKEVLVRGATKLTEKVEKIPQACGTTSKKGNSLQRKVRSTHPMPVSKKVDISKQRIDSKYNNFQ